MELNASEQKELLRLARKTIADACRQGLPPEVEQRSYPAAFMEQRATFVTLQKNNELRGCIGSLQAHRPLIEDIVHNAFAAAFRDFRFQPVTETELSDLEVEISILGPMTEMNVSSEEDLLAQLVPGKDGLVIESALYSATFLPQVWEQLPTPGQFLLHLKQKAGMPLDLWPENMKCSCYTCNKLKERQ